jgi:hypothetical protein
MKNEVVSEYGTMEKRRATVVQTNNGFRVDLYERMEFVRSVECYDHSENYAEDVAENWVLGVL